MNYVCYRDVHAPSAYVARGLENLLIFCKSTQDPLLHKITCIASKIIGCTLVPCSLLVDILLEPVYILKDFFIGCYTGKSEDPNKTTLIERVSKKVLGILLSPLAWIAADSVSYLFLQTKFSPTQIVPFGVEGVFGTKLKNPILFPSNVEEIQEAVLQAKKLNQKISIIGSGMSQGEQVVPPSPNDKALSLQNINYVKFLEEDENLVEVGAGATWEDIILELNKKAKSILVKQASNVFSIGGSLGIGCHGWQHSLGSIASTIVSLTIVDANGEIKVISREKDPELFSCMFGTLGYFGIIVSAVIKVTDNIELEEKGEVCSIEDFHAKYTAEIKDNPDKPLLMGRLNINHPPLQTLYINTFETTENKQIEPTSTLSLEAARGQRVERMFLDAIGHLPASLYKNLVDLYWKREVDIMVEGHRKASRNEIMHFGIKSFFQLHQSHLFTQWLQEYFISPENLPEFIKFLGDILDKNEVRLLNASIRPTPKDEVSILPYAEKDRYAIVISFHQLKTEKEIKKTKAWIEQVQSYLLEKGDKWYQAYMPYATQEQFEQCYGDSVDKMRELKKKYDPDNVFSNRHTSRYFDKKTT